VILKQFNENSSEQQNKCVKPVIAGQAPLEHAGEREQIIVFNFGNTSWKHFKQ
jgi:hypothetical protein